MAELSLCKEDSYPDRFPLEVEEYKCVCSNLPICICDFSVPFPRRRFFFFFSFLPLLWNIVRIKR